jgi:hypothetical protein
VQNDEQKTLDFFPHLWYNGQSGRLAKLCARQPAANFKKMQIAVKKG